VRTDWAVAPALLAAGDTRAAGSLLVGEPMAAPPAGRYAWLAREPVARGIAALVTDRCAAAAEDLLAAGDAAEATAVLLAALRVSPYAGPLWDLLETATGVVDEAGRDDIRAVRAARVLALPF
jgi:hypothetical protein